MKKYIFVKIHSNFQTYKTENDENYNPGDVILVRFGQSVEPASVIDKNEFPQAEVNSDLEIVRLLSDDDKLKIAELKTGVKSFVTKSNEIIKKHNLPMKILDADLSFDGQKLTFYFSAESRVDFRQLVSDLARSFHKLIRLQQIGARNQAKILGGFGKCGRSICCNNWLDNLDSITLDMAQKQGLNVTGSAKISGYCGKLMCCLSYELDSYQQKKSKGVEST